MRSTCSGSHEEPCFIWGSFFNSIVRPKGAKIFSRVSKRGEVILASRRAIEDCGKWQSFAKSRCDKPNS